MSALFLFKNKASMAISQLNLGIILEPTSVTMSASIQCNILVRDGLRLMNVRIMMELISGPNWDILSR